MPGWFDPRIFSIFRFLYSDPIEADNETRLLHQKDWAEAPTAQDSDYVDLSDMKWRKGYGEDEEQK